MVLCFYCEKHSNSPVDEAARLPLSAVAPPRKGMVITMKKAIILLMVNFLFVSLFSCWNNKADDSQPESFPESKTESVEASKDEVSEDFSSFPSFSYADAVATYTEGEPGVKKDGFNNSSATAFSTAEELIELAKNEATIVFNETTVYYDSAADMFLVLFYTEDIAGGGQSVYIDKNGVTQLIVYGE